MEPLSWALGVLVALALAVVALFTSRTRTLAHRLGSFDCRIEASTHAVVAGIAHYGVDRLYWWRLWSLSPRPARAWVRRDLVILDLEEIEIPGKPGICRVRCHYGETRLDLQMSLAAFAGLTSWLESAPPAEHGISA